MDKNNHLKKSIIIEMSDLEVGGIQYVDINISNYFCSMNYTVFILVPRIGTGKKHNIHNAVRLIFVPKSILLRTLFLFKFLIKNRITIYFGLYNKPRFIAILFKVPVIIQILHNCYSYSKKEFLFEQFLKRHTNYVSVSNAVRDYSIKALKLPEEKVTTIYNGIDITKYSPRKTKAFEKIKVCSIGRLVQQKGFDYLIEIASHFLNFERAVEFCIIGDGPESLKLQHLRNIFDPEGKLIKFLGERLDVNDILPECHIFTSTIRYGGFEIVLVEAMSSGLPVVAFDVGPVREVIGECGPGILVQPGNIVEFYNKLKHLLLHPKEIIERGQQSRKRAERLFNINNSLQCYESLIKKLHKN